MCELMCVPNRVTCVYICETVDKLHVTYVNEEEIDYTDQESHPQSLRESPGEKTKRIVTRTI